MVLIGRGLRYRRPIFFFHLFLELALDFPGLIDNILPNSLFARSQSDGQASQINIFEVDFDRMAAHGELGKNVLLQEGDVIYVPPTVLAALAMKIEEVIRPIARAFTGVYLVQNAGNNQRNNTYLGGYSGQ